MPEDMSVPNHENSSSPELMSHERLGRLISAVGNHEGKALLMSAMEMGEEYSRRDLHNLVKLLPGASEAYVGSHRNQSAYCEYSLIPAGLVEAEGEGRERTYHLADEGEAHGQTLALMLLDFADRHGIGLSKIFGGSSSRDGKSSPYSRIWLMEEVLTSPQGMSVKEVGEASGLAKGTLTDHLIKLSDLNLISWRPWAFDTDQSSYVVGPEIDRPLNIRRDPSDITKDFLDFVRLNGSVTRADFKEYEKARMAERGENLSDEDFEKKMHNAIEGQVKIGRIERDVKREALAYSQDAASVIVLNPEQELFWSELLNLLENYRKIDIEDSSLREKWAQNRRDLLGNMGFVSRALNRIAAESPLMQDGSEKSSVSVVRQALAAGESPMSVRDIQTHAAKLVGRALSQPAVANALDELGRSKRLTAGQDPRVSKYSLNS